MFNPSNTRCIKMSLQLGFNRYWSVLDVPAARDMTATIVYPHFNAKPASHFIDIA
jgi:hypothetical protein